MFNNPFMMGFPQQQPIQTMQIQPQASCFFVKSASDLTGVNVMPNVFYVGLSPDNKEIYVRKMNNDGNIELEVLKTKKANYKQFPKGWMQSKKGLLQYQRNAQF